MNTLGLILGLAAVASASIIPHHGAVPASVAVRAPSHDSAIIQSHRLGGNFAYRTDEAHAYAVQSPVLGQRTVPVGVSYHQGTPIVKTSTDYVSRFVPQTGVATYQAPTQVISQPIVAQQAVAVAPAVHAAPAVAVAPAAHASYAPATHAAYAPATYASGAYAAYAPAVAPTTYTHATAAIPAVHGGVYAHGVQAAGGYGGYAVPSAGVYTHGVRAAGGYAVPSAGVYAHGLPAAGAYAHGLSGYKVAAKAE